ncbi:hypothetical protein PF66_02588 [Pseudomonas asplenii]|uniref:Uncharacterized protein n=1 Tax=Pseudomonas asplenii TaxID=53407 RepID=A0A0M9GGM0_9PSED|nr:hypothetical protein PF66_02588 [Pseudomonas fuscovaginae]
MTPGRCAGVKPAQTLVGAWLASEASSALEAVFAGKPGSYKDRARPLAPRHRPCRGPGIYARLILIRLRELRARRIDSITAAHDSPTISPSHNPLGPLGAPNQSVSPSA